MLKSTGPSADPFEYSTDQLPSTDEGRLIFYAELLVANIPSLISDLSSAKNTFLSFSEKKRNEVKQKSSLIQSISQSLSNTVSVYKSCKNMEEILAGYELQLVTAAPPEFLSAEEALARRTSEQESEGAQGSAHIIILEPDDLKPVKEVEATLQAVVERSTSLQQEAEQMLHDFTEARTECEAMTAHVQSLRKVYNDVLADLHVTENTLRHIELTREEEEARNAIEIAAATAIARTQVDCRNAELNLIQTAILKTNAEVAELSAELHTRREQNEVELAAFQIAWKDQQAQSDTLKDTTSALNAHQRELEVLAKKQQLEESDKNSLRTYVLQSLWSSEDESNLDRPLPPQRDDEVKRDQPLVELLAARIHLLNQQRQDIACLLTRVHDLNDTSALSHVITSVSELLRDDVGVNEDALAGNTTPTK